jgi:hypothetical protein
MESRDNTAQGFPILAYYCSLLHPPLAYVNHTKALVKVITTNIHVNRMTRLEGNTRKYIGGEA